MAAAKKPIRIKDFVGPVETTRKVLMDEEADKIKGRRGMMLKAFQTDKEKLVIFK